MLPFLQIEEESFITGIWRQIFYFHLNYTYKVNDPRPRFP
jgi:hypothetical protein